MSRKILASFVVFCMLLGMVPAVFANDITDALGISEEEVAMYVSEDTTLSEDVEGLVLVTAPVRVIIDGAKLATGLVLAPDAGEATVTITDAADVNAVVVLSDATVIVEESATVANIEVSAADADVEIAGTVGNVTVDEDAAGSKVTVAQAAKVTTVAVAAANVNVAVSGAVETVTVAQTAASASVTVAQTATVSTVAVSGSNAKVDVAGTVKSVEVKAAATGSSVTVEKSANVSKVEVAASDVTVGVAGTVGTVDVARTATGATLVVEESATIEEVNDSTGSLATEGAGAGNIEVNDKSTPATSDDNDDDVPDDTIDRNETVTEKTVHEHDVTAEVQRGFGIKSAPLADWSGHTDGQPGPAFKDKKPSLSIYDDLRGDGLVSDDREYDLVLKGSVEPHKGDPEGEYEGDKKRDDDVKWIGIAIPKEPTYVLFLIDTENNTVKPIKPDNTWSDNDDNDYDTYYFNGDNAKTPGHYTIGVVKLDDAVDKWEDAVKEAEAKLEAATVAAVQEILDDVNIDIEIEIDDIEDIQAELADGKTLGEILEDMIAEGEELDITVEIDDELLDALDEAEFAGFDYIFHLEYDNSGEGESVSPETGDVEVEETPTPSGDDATADVAVESDDTIVEGGSEVTEPAA